MQHLRKTREHQLPRYLAHKRATLKPINYCDMTTGTEEVDVKISCRVIEGLPSV